MKTIYHLVLRDTNGYIKYIANLYLCKGCGNLKTNKRIGRKRGSTIKSSNIKGHFPHEFHAKNVLFIHSHQPDSLEMDFSNQPNNLYYHFLRLFTGLVFFAALSILRYARLLFWLTSLPIASGSCLLTMLFWFVRISTGLA